MREAPALDIIRGLVKNGAEIKAYCPQGMKEAEWRLKDIGEHIKYCSNEYEAVQDTDAAVVVTEWNQFRGMNLKRVKKAMRDNYLFDLRNIYSKSSEADKLFKYFGVGKS